MPPLPARLRRRAGRLARELAALARAYRDPGTPRTARGAIAIVASWLVLGLAVGLAQVRALA